MSNVGYGLNQSRVVKMACKAGYVKTGLQKTEGKEKGIQLRKKGKTVYVFPNRITDTSVTKEVIFSTSIFVSPNEKIVEKICLFLGLDPQVNAKFYTTPQSMRVQQKHPGTPLRKIDEQRSEWQVKKELVNAQRREKAAQKKAASAQKRLANVVARVAKLKTVVSL